jgi:DNA segregation ATPase FtsK/SpoIIIE, S-DNA-T family
MKLTNKKTQSLIKQRIQYWEDYNSDIEIVKSLETKISDISDLSKNISLNQIKKVQAKTDEIQSNYHSIESIIDEANKNKGDYKASDKKIEGLLSVITALNKEVDKQKNNIKICYFLFFLIIPLFLVSGFKRKINANNEEITKYKKEISELKKNQRAYSEKLNELNIQYKSIINSIKKNIRTHHISQLNEFSNKTNQELIDNSLCNYYEWDLNIWNSWKVNSLKIYSDLCIGKFSEELSDLKFDLPATVPFIGEAKTLIFTTNSKNSNIAKSLLEGLILRISLMIPHQVTFTFFDQGSMSQTFSSIRKDVEERHNTNNNYRLLEAITDDIHRITNTYGLSNHQPFDSILDNILINEKFELIFVANFPKEFDSREIKTLQRIANYGYVAGKYVILHYDNDISLPRELTMDSFENEYIIDLENTEQYGGSDCKFRFTLSSKVEDKIKNHLIERLNDSKPPERVIKWDDEVAIPKNEWWNMNAVESIETSIGRSGSSEKLNIWFGAKKEKEGGRPCAHGMLAGMTGSGKSNLYHILILGLAIRYSPRELSLYLIDGKDGVEFQPYRNLPHAEFISLKSQPKLSRSILNELIEEKERRNNIFSQHGENDYKSFRNKYPKEILPRILLLVDEFQELFEGDKDGIASNCLLSLAQQGRSVGIHMLLGSQRFNMDGMMLHETSFKGNMHLLIAMKMSPSDIDASQEFKREGKHLIYSCNLPGKVVINDQSGADGANKSGKVAKMTKDNRDDIISKIIEKTKTEKLPSEVLTTNIFHGAEQPKILDNPQLNHLINETTYLSETEFENFARKEIYKGGLGEISWSVGHKPVVGWIGQEFNVRGQANIIIRRRRQENIMLIGDQNEARFAMILALIVSFAVNSNTQNNFFYIIDKSVKGTPWNRAITFIKDELIVPLGIENRYVTNNSELINVLDDLNKELENRKNEDEDLDESKNIFIFGIDIENFDSLCQIPNKYGTLEDSELGIKLQNIYTSGPPKGIYTIFSFESVMSMFGVVAKKNIDFFRHRIALQMSEDDSFTFVKRREASRLVFEGKKPISSFYIDMGINKFSVFKPYFLDETFYSQINEICKLQKNK